MTNTPKSIHEVAQLASRRNGGVGGRALERLASQKGLTISRTTLDRMLRGSYSGTPDTQTIEALSVLASVPEALLRALTGVPEPLRPLAEDLPPDADTLTPEQRDTVLSVVRQFAKANRALAQLERQEQRHGTPQEGTPNTRAAGSAAHHEHDDVMPAPPTADELGLAANRAPRERAYDDQTEAQDGE